MSYSDSFHPRRFISGSTSHQLSDLARREYGFSHLRTYSGKYRELSPSGFEGPVAEWARERIEKFGDKIVPRLTVFEEAEGGLHRVSWLYRSVLDFDTGNSISFHHLACDCILEDEFVKGDPSLIFGCSALQAALIKRAAWLNEEYRISDILSTEQYTDKEGPYLSQKGQEFALRAIIYLMESDKLHPESWMGNVISGQHMVSLVALILQQRLEPIEELVRRLEDGGVIELDEVGTIELIED